MNHALAAAALIAVTALTGCPGENDEPLTLGEAREALEEAAMSTQAMTMLNGTIELSTSFTIGSAVEAAAAELGAYIESQLPCAEITLAGNRHEVAYGARTGHCLFRGHAYSGTHAVTVTASGDGQVIVEHEWDGLQNGIYSATGEATVTWDAAV